MSFSKRFFSLLVASILCCGVRLAARCSGAESYSFITAGDMRGFVGPGVPGKRYFDGLCETLAKIGPGEFMVSPGDCDPPGPVRGVIDRYLGTNYLWYPVVGNHDVASAADMAWMKKWAENGIPHLARLGPPGSQLTTYSFDFGNSHLVVINDYFDGHIETARKDDLPDVILEWLEKDLVATKKPLIWVFGHKPIETQPDMDTGRIRHGKDSISTNSVQLARFVALLKVHHVRAYICGHTHDSSVVKVKGIWQADSGHARGAGDKGAPSTFLRFRVEDRQTWVDVYRADPKGENYQIRKTVELD